MIGFEKALVSKVLIFEHDSAVHDQLKEFCSTHGLIGVKQTTHSAMKMLYTNVDLGAVIISEKSHDGVEGLKNGFEMAQRISKIRKELPIFIRRESRADMDDLSPEQRRGIAGAFVVDRPETLTKLVDQYLADTEYPISLIRRIEEVSHQSLTTLFKNMDVTNELPYLVKDKLTWGDMISIIPVESPWFDGYMMVQTEEQPLINAIRAGKTSIEPENTDFRDVMGILSEICNLAWGGLKTRLLALTTNYVKDPYKISVPITVNQYKEYISFGTDRSQLCFKYTLRDTTGKVDPVTIYQKFIFNIRWNPEEYRESDQNTVEELVESGELELF
jgi:hypothetical protein